MFLRFEENPNCGFADDRVLQERSAPKPITHVLCRRQGQDVWCEVTGVHPGALFQPAYARKVDDSGDGVCFLVYGGRWGLRLKDSTCAHAWSLEDPHQWAEPFLLLPASGEDVRFA